MSRSPRSLRRSLVRAVASASAIAGVCLGCSPNERTIVSEVVYEPPMERSVVVETVVDLDFETTWNALIRRLSESPYRVAALEKASRFVRVDLVRSSDLAAAFNKPARFVDCGRTTRTFIADVGAAPERFEYVVAESSRYTESDVAPDGFRVSEVERRVDLEASATIFLQPEGTRRTRVTVKSRYQVEIEISGRATFHPLDADEPIASPRSFGPRTESIRFTTFQPGKDTRRGGLTCRATGDFEHALVALANPAAAI